MNIAVGDRKAVRLGLGAMIAIVLAFRLAPWAVRTVAEDRHLLADRVAVLDRYQVEVAALKDLEDSATTVARSLANLGRAAIAGDTEAAAVSTLIEHVGSTVARSGGRLLGNQWTPDSTPKDALLAQVLVRVTVEVTLPGLLTTLRQLESTNPRVVLQGVKIEAQPPAEPLRAELVVAGWYRPKTSGRPG